MSDAIILMGFSRGMGVTYHLAQLACELRRLGQQNGLEVCFAGPSQEAVPGCWRTVEAAFPPEAIIRLVDEDRSVAGLVAPLLKRFENVVFVVQGSRQACAISGLRRAHPKRVKVVALVHSFRNSTWQGPIVSRIVAFYYKRNVDYTIFLSPFAFRTFVGSAGLVAGGRGGIVPLGIEEQGEPSEAGVPAELLSLVNQPNAFRLVYLANFHPNKGHLWLVEGLRPLLARYGQLRLMFAGEGPLRAEVQRVAAKAGILGQVDLPGRVARNFVPWLTSRCHVGLVGSGSETFGHNYLEPMALGLPVVGTRVGVGEWLIQDFLTGIGVLRGDDEALRQAVEFLFLRPEEAREMGRRAQALVREHFSWRNVTSAHLRICMRLLDECHKVKDVPTSRDL